MNFETRFARWAQRGQSRLGLFAASFLEATVLPVPIELLMIPVMLADRARAWQAAAAVLAGCLAGVAAMYLVGVIAFEAVGAPVIAALGLEARYQDFLTYAQENGVMALLIINVTPIPLFVAALGAAVLGLSPVTVFGIIALTRASRYFALALLVWWLGPHIMTVLKALETRPRLRMAAWAAGVALAIAALAWPLIV
ncbi:MAG: lipoprotein B [Oceanicaulis sp. HLUCCA04]|nr:MAG: lipoprotein B [Oceanicaulis sp. HLUCCA04]